MREDRLLATSTRRERPVRTLVTLGVLVIALFGALFAGARWSDGSLTPELALDLQGGTQLILKPTAEDESKVTPETISQAIDIIRQRIDASGVAEAEITSQGDNQIVVGIPGTPSQATLDLVRQSAQMYFRAVIKDGAPTVSDPETAAADLGTPADGSDLAWLTQDVLDEYAAYDCTDPANLTGGTTASGDTTEPIVACDQLGTTKYVLGPAEVSGDEISNASSGLETSSTGAVTTTWIVSLDFNGQGTTDFREVTTRLVDLESPRNQFAIVLDGLVISAPRINEVIPSGQAQISGTFTRESAATLAQQLNFGALPLTFEVQSEQSISATLGSEQLQRGILAGLIGLGLVGLYSLVQYRGLASVTIASLIVAGGITYGLIALLSWTQGYRLSLPGVAGLIVAIGITADSFIVYFERVRDELRDGRTLPAAVSHAWVRARRTILASDAVNFLAALVLYFLAVGGVRGFAFTLGLTTLVDLVVVFLFTHPALTVLAKTRFFAEGHRFSGLDQSTLTTGARYAGRGRVAVPGRPSSADGAAGGDAVGSPDPQRMTIAERKAAARAAAAPATETGSEPGTDGKDA